MDTRHRRWANMCLRCSEPQRPVRGRAEMAWCIRRRQAQINRSHLTGHTNWTTVYSKVVYTSNIWSREVTSHLCNLSFGSTSIPVSSPPAGNPPGCTRQKMLWRGTGPGCLMLLHLGSHGFTRRQAPSKLGFIPDVLLKKWQGDVTHNASRTRLYKLTGMKVAMDHLACP